MLCEMAFSMPLFTYAFLMVWVLQMYITGAPMLRAFGWLLSVKGTDDTWDGLELSADGTSRDFFMIVLFLVH